jgi:hypothetical protein
MNPSQPKHRPSIAQRQLLSVWSLAKNAFSWSPTSSLPH